MKKNTDYFVPTRKTFLARVSLLLVMALLALSVHNVSRTQAAVIAVACDPNALIAAIITANANGQADTLDLTPGCTYTLTSAKSNAYGGSGLPMITSDITINGNGAIIERSTASDTPEFRIFNVENTTLPLVLNDVQIRNGHSSVFSGGAIFAKDASVIINNSTLTDNTSSMQGGAIYASNTHVMQINNSTIANNEAQGSGGGIYVLEGINPVEINSSTIVMNSADINQNGNGYGDNGGGIATVDSPPVLIKNSIIAQNTDESTAGEVHTDVSGEFVPGGYNLIGNNTGAETSFPAGQPNAYNDMVGTESSPIDPMLGNLTNNGGLTPTYAIQNGSPALDAGNPTPDATTPATDQRGAGFPRVDTVTARMDIGSFEARKFTLTVNKDATGDGSGTVSSAAAGIVCDPACTTVSQAVVEGEITLVANPQPGHVFEGWSGDCTGTSTNVTILMDADKACTARFTYNFPPNVLADVATTDEDLAVIIDVLANDDDSGDPDGGINPATTALVTTPVNGTATVDPASGAITYTPTPNFYGADTFQYQVCDIGTPLPSKCGTATVNITVNPINDAPVAANDQATTNEDVPITIPIFGNDNDIDGNLVPASIVTTPPISGTLTVQPDGSILYTPSPNFNGTDSFTYQVSDDGTPLPALTSNVATVNITIQAVNDPPVATDDTAITNEDIPVLIDVLANDNDDLDVGSSLDLSALTVATEPQHGEATVNADGTIQYTPEADFYGSDSIQYEICDTGIPLPAECATANVAITVASINDPPTFDAGRDQHILQDDGPQTVEEWATNITPGAENELHQTLAFSLTIVGTTGAITFTDGPRIDPTTGTLEYTVDPTSDGGATIEVVLIDSEGAVSAPQQFTISVYSDPSAVEMLTFTAKPSDAGITITWQTLLEHNTWGFHIVRSTDGTRENGERVTSDIIPAKGSTTTGASYSWTDTNVADDVTYTYWLEEVTLDGNTNKYGATASTASSLYETFLPLVVR